MNDQSLKGVLFDLDGTLADTIPLCIAAFRSAIEPAIGVALTDAEIVATFGPSEEGTILALAPSHYDECLASYVTHYERLHAAHPDLFDGMRELLGEIKARGAKLGLVTGKGPLTTPISLKQFGLVNSFDVIETGSPFGSRKVEAMRNVLAKWQLQADEAVYIGDATTDITAARDVGMAVVAAAWSPTADRQSLAALTPDYLADTVAALREWLLARL
jgi:HAD superfamily hydrolase (TIGR01549 family)